MRADGDLTDFIAFVLYTFENINRYKIKAEVVIYQYGDGYQSSGNHESV